MTRALPQGSMPARRLWLTLAALAFLFLGAVVARAEETVVRIGYQKYGTLLLLKGKGLLEPKLAGLGIGVRWVEFPAGPQLLEALNAGAIDLGSTGEAPPIFAQAASGSRLVYVAHEPAAPEGEAIIVPKGSPLASVADLKGKKVALNKGSNVHYLLVRALEQAGLAYGDIQPVFLAPADARAAFERGAVDAWAIWDPYLAAAEAATGARTLATGAGAASNVQFYLADRGFAETQGRALDEVLSAIDETDRWAGANPEAAAAELAPAVGIPAPILAVALKRQTYGVTPLGPEVVEGQQRVADSFARLGLLPKPVAVGEAVRRAGS